MIESGGCNKCLYEHTEEFEPPCILCKRNFSEYTEEFERHMDYFKPKEGDMVNHPQHYQHGIEPIDYIESHGFNFNLGNVIKYVSRAPYKGTELQDLEKAKFYLEREIKRHENN